MDELELGQATITYEDPEAGTVTETVENEEIVYARDHWMVKAGTDEDGNDLMHQIPRDRVHHVARSAEEFEDQIDTVRHRVESIASDLRERIPVDIGDGGRRDRGDVHGEEPPSESTTVQIETESDEREHDESEPEQ
ncbi:hypothetical protein [Halorientalis pallida]|uniref:Uncharacterized protein n=1 Tax=Halorientalis pallida TaxID=2479928 RepID=A0A498L9G4_9EURY|nr:hypothetical protein [Halorientalis pallida]RXK51813.1 hypothetical protein EAF64_04050 [Halorientalis pallida]